MWTVVVKVLWRHFSDPSTIWKVGSQYSSLVLPTFLCDRTSDNVPLEAMLEALVVLVEMLLCLASMVVNLVIAISIRYIRFHDTITLKVSLLCHRHIHYTDKLHVVLFLVDNLRESFHMMRDPAKVLLGNLSISNLLCAVFVQLISAILDGYAISINNYRVINSHTTPNFLPGLSV